VNHLRGRWGCGLGGPKKPRVRWGPRSILGKGQFWEDMKQRMLDNYGTDWNKCTVFCSSLLKFGHILTVAPHHSVFTSWKLGLMPNKQCESTEGKLSSITLLHVVILLVVRMSVVLVAAASLMVTYCNVI